MDNLKAVLMQLLVAIVFFGMAILLGGMSPIATFIWLTMGVLLFVISLYKL